MSNEVIVIGGDHHNTLAIIRNLGKNKVNFRILIHTSNVDEKNSISISHSKYSKNLEVVNEKENLIISWLIDKKLSIKQLIIPASDFAEYVIDKNYNKLKKYYFIPGFNNNPGQVVKLMNKYEQKKWADYYKIPMAKSWNIIKKDGIFHIPNDIILPCIIKPTISAIGSKSDIIIVDSKEELEKRIVSFNNSDYDNLIIQEFIKKKYEICAIGCIVKDNYYGQVIRKIRENPPLGGGSLTYARFIDDDKINKNVDMVISKLIYEGYQGLYDIEFLVCDDYIYLNEINFRHSGNGYALIKSGIMAPYILYLYHFHKNIEFNKKGKLIYFIDDFNELHLLKNNYISFFVFLSDFFHAKAHSIFDITDLGVFKFKMNTMIVKKLRKNEK